MAPYALALTAACGPDRAAVHVWQGTMDTLASGQLLIQNPDHGMWRPGEEWRVVIGLLRSDVTFSSADTLVVPIDPVERSTLTAMEGRIRAAVPFQGNLTWRLTPSGTMIAMVTDQYRIFELDRSGDTLRTITRAFSPLPVTAADREQARENMTWFTDQGGHLDVSALPRIKPVARGFFLDEDEGYLWVELDVSGSMSSHYDIFDPDGRYLGTIELPFSLSRSPTPIIRDDLLYGVVEDDLGVSYLLRARIERS